MFQPLPQKQSISDGVRRRDVRIRTSCNVHEPIDAGRRPRPLIHGRARVRLRNKELLVESRFSAEDIGVVGAARRAPELPGR